jgi:carboxymethylenebutenolidase
MWQTSNPRGPITHAASTAGSSHRSAINAIHLAAALKHAAEVPAIMHCFQTGDGAEAGVAHSQPDHGQIRFPCGGNHGRIRAESAVADQTYGGPVRLRVLGWLLRRDALHRHFPLGKKEFCIILVMLPPDLVKLWEEHTTHEFTTRDTEATLATMTDDAYVNHVPVMTGGYGKPALRHFYSHDFIPSMPSDTTLARVSMTIGESQLVEEMIFSFTHTQEIPWMLPGVPPTHRRVEVPLVAVVGFRDGKLAHERIYWDQASVLKQIGLLKDDSLPVVGAETARKVLAPRSP